MVKNHQTTMLPNGMRVVTEFMPGTKSVGISIGVGTGSRFEGKEERGISHFLEHMLFKSTKEHTNQELSVALDAMDAQPNASTSHENTTFDLHVLPQDIDKAIGLLGEMIEKPVFAATELATEKRVVMEEIREYLDDNATMCVEQMQKQAFPKQSLGRNILGTIESVGATTPEKLKGYMQRHYTPGNMVIAITGNINPQDHTKILATVQKHFTNKQPLATRHQVSVYKGGDVRKTKELAHTYVTIGLPIPLKSKRDHTIAELYEQILDGGFSFRLHHQVREIEGLVYSVDAVVNAFQDNALLQISASTSPKRAGELASTLCKQINSMSQISDEELVRAKKMMKSQLIKASQLPDDTAKDTADDLTVLGWHQTAEEKIADIESITKEEVIGMANAIKLGKLTFSALGECSHIPPYPALEALIASQQERRTIRLPVGASL
ncbi:MAG: insulinase family protein [Alphaproteobacteria bacterium]|nr:insulinase family protein [Alphaproteobacteria bacterium]